MQGATSIKIPRAKQRANGPKSVFPTTNSRISGNNIAKPDQPPPPTLIRRITTAVASDMPSKCPACTQCPCSVSCVPHSAHLCTHQGSAC